MNITTQVSRLDSKSRKVGGEMQQSTAHTIQVDGKTFLHGGPKVIVTEYPNGKTTITATEAYGRIYLVDGKVHQFASVQAAAEALVAKELKQTP
jgi:hypothetical protein